MSVLSPERPSTISCEASSVPKPPIFEIPLTHTFTEALNRLNLHFQRNDIGFQLHFFEENSPPSSPKLISITSDAESHVFNLPDRPIATIISIRQQVESDFRQRKNYADGRPIPDTKLLEELLLLFPQYLNHGRLFDVMQVQPTSNHTPWRIWREHFTFALSD